MRRASLDGERSFQDKGGKEISRSLGRIFSSLWQDTNLLFSQLLLLHAWLPSNPLCALIVQRVFVLADC